MVSAWNGKAVFRLLGFLLAAATAVSAQGVRKAAFAGQFYPGERDALSRQIDGFLKESSQPALEAGVLGLIVPHAGYTYSGRIAACAYAAAAGSSYDTVVIIGPAHRVGFEGCSVYPEGGYETPLGVAEIDAPLAEKIATAGGFVFLPQAHREEHAVEVQVPFIQKTFPQAKIVPILMGRPVSETVFALSAALKKCLPGTRTLVVASTDLSHFLTHEEASELDKKTIQMIRQHQTTSLLHKIERGANLMCGGGPVVSVLQYVGAYPGTTVQVLSYADSSAAGGPRDRVVGYFAGALVSPSSPPTFSLSAPEKDQLLRLSRTALRQSVLSQPVDIAAPANPNLRLPRGAFVTLKKKGVLRGCIGFTEPRLPLYQSVAQAAVFAASRDPRFSPVKESELSDLEIEISVLGPLVKVDAPRSIKVGTHGLMIEKNGARGLLLPQVAVENHWNRSTFLQQTCRKAGLPPDAWKSGARIYTFEALVFHESRPD